MLAPWRSLLAAALHRNRSQPFARYFQLATVNPAGYPANRTVVFRGFLNDDHNRLKMITDLRSAKIEDIQRQPWAEICWYFTKTREQFRIAGQLQLVTAQETDLDLSSLQDDTSPRMNSGDTSLQTIRKMTWQQLSDPGRSQFAWPDPGQHKSAFEVTAIDPHDPHDNFCLLLLTPNRIDHLQLRGDPQQRCVYTLEHEQTWTHQEVNP